MMQWGWEYGALGECHVTRYINCIYCILLTLVLMIEMNRNGVIHHSIDLMEHRPHIYGLHNIGADSTTDCNSTAMT